jgi:hypothetical protein
MSSTLRKFISLTSAIQEMGATYNATVPSDVEQNEEVNLKEFFGRKCNTLLMLAE